MTGARRIYCIVPRDLAAKLHEPLRRFYRDSPEIEVVVERREEQRRIALERRAPSEQLDAAAFERRRIRNLAGRRFGERRTLFEPLERPPLPRKAERYADRLVFVARAEEAEAQPEDVETDRMIARAQAGDRTALTELYLRYFDRVYTYLRIVLRESPDAEDAAQEVFVRVLRALPGYDFRGRPFQAWLFTVARNHAVNLLRAESHVEVEEPAEISRQREMELANADLRALDWISDRDLLVFIERLPLAQRQALVLRFLADLSAGEIGEILGRSPDSVRQLQHRALSFLRARVEALGRTPTRGGHETMVRLFRQAVVLRARRFVLLP